MLQKITDKKLKICLTLAWLTIIFGLSWLSGLSNLDPDLGWHLKFGADIQNTHQLPKQQIHLWTLGPDATWVDHEWLINWIMFLVYNATGYWGLTAFFALIFSAGYLIIYRFLTKNRSLGVYLIAGLILLLGYMVSAHHLGARPQMLAILFMALTCRILLTAETKKIYKTALGLGLIFWLWASSHAAFVGGLMVVALWSLNQLWQAWRQGDKHFLWLGLAGGLSALGATCVTAYGLRLYDFLFTYQDYSMLIRHISEWRSLWIWPIHYWQLFFWSLAAALAIIIIFINREAKKIAPWAWASVALFAAMSLQSIRHFPLFFVLTALLIIPALLPQTKTSQNKLTRSISLWLLPLQIIVLIVIGLELSKLPLTDPFTHFCSRFPCQTYLELKNNSDYADLRLFNHYNYGGYLIWLWPEKQLFIDGRLPQYPFKGHSLIEEFVHVYTSPIPGGTLALYDIEAILWPKARPEKEMHWLEKLLFFRHEQPKKTDAFSDWLLTSPDWQLVADDEASRLFIRRDKLKIGN